MTNLSYIVQSASRAVVVILASLSLLLLYNGTGEPFVILTPAVLCLATYILGRTDGRLDAIHNRIDAAELERIWRRNRIGTAGAEGVEGVEHHDPTNPEPTR